MTSHLSSSGSNIVLQRPRLIKLLVTHHTNKYKKGSKIFSKNTSQQPFVIENLIKSDTEKVFPQLRHYQCHIQIQNTLSTLSLKLKRLLALQKVEKTHRMKEILPCT